MVNLFMEIKQASQKDKCGFPSVVLLGGLGITGLFLLLSCYDLFLFLCCDEYSLHYCWG